MANMTYAQFKTDYYNLTGVEDDKDFLIVYTEYTDGLEKIGRSYAFVPTTTATSAQKKRLQDDWEETNMSAGALIAARSAIARWQCIRREGHPPRTSESLAQATKVRKSVTDDASILLNTYAAKANRGCEHTKACLLDLAQAFARKLYLDGPFE